MRRVGDLKCCLEYESKYLKEIAEFTSLACIYLAIFNYRFALYVSVRSFLGNGKNSARVGKRLKIRAAVCL